nr:sigma-70 family RNA polymerase sigma factor [Nannocystis pusilla]
MSELVAAFQYRAHPLSRAAVGLAAGVPGCVDLDLLRALGTQLTMGRITPTHLAEAMTSGLFRRSGEGESTVIAFVSEQARREGLRWLPRADLPRILNYVIRYVEDGLDTDPWLCLPSLPLLVALHNRQAPPEGVELKVGRIGELRAWVNATGFVVHEKLRTLMDGSAELVRPVTRRNHTAPSIREVVFRERERLREIVEMGLRQLDLSVDQADEPVDITDVVELELSIDHIEVAEHEASALVHLSGKAMLMGSFSRTDYDNAISDSEDGTWHNAETVYETATFKVRWNTGFEVWTDSETVHPLSGIPKIHIDSSHFFHDELDILSSEPSEGYDEDDHEPLEQDDFEPKNSEPEPSEPDGQNLPEVDDFAPEDHEPESPEPVELEFESSETNNQESEPGEFRRHDHESETPKAGDALPESDDPERGDFEDAFPEPDEREPQPSELEELGAQPGLTVLASEEDDRNLFEAWCAGDLRAGNVLAKRHYARLRRFFLSKDEQHYQDLTNRTFLECIKSRHNFRGDITFRGYLFAIAYRVLCRHLQERRRRDFESFDPEVHAVVDTELPEMSSYVLANEQARMLLECLRRLTINAQTVLELRYWSDLTEPEIQEVLKLKSRETVAGRLRVAKAALQREWARVQPGHALADADFDAWMLEIRGHVDAKNPRNV